MAYTYLITGATSDVGAALIRHLLTEGPPARTAPFWHRAAAIWPGWMP